MTSRQNRIQAALTTAFQPKKLEITDDSARHAGHAGASAAGESHFNIAIAADVFNGLSRVEAHRKINEALSSEFDSGLHALSIKILPTE